MLLGDELALELVEELEVLVVLCAVHEWVVVVAKLAGCREDLLHVCSELAMDWLLMGKRSRVGLWKLWGGVIVVV